MPEGDPRGANRSKTFGLEAYRPAVFGKLYGIDADEMSPAYQLKFRQLAGPYAILRIAADAAAPDWATTGEFSSITRTRDEISIVCPIANVPEQIDHGPRWICFKLEGPFPFSQTGVLLSFIEPLSRNNIPIFAVSTYDTDYILVQESFLAAALQTCREAGHRFQN